MFFKFPRALFLEWMQTIIKALVLITAILYLGYSWYENEKWERNNQTLELDMFMEDLSLLRDVKNSTNSKLSIQAKYWQRLNERQQFFKQVKVQQVKNGQQWTMSAGEMICYDADKCWLRDHVVITKNQQIITTEQMNADFGLSIFTSHSPAVFTTPTQVLNVTGFSISELQNKQYLIELKGRLKLIILPNNK